MNADKRQLKTNDLTLSYPRESGAPGKAWLI